MFGERVGICCVAFGLGGHLDQRDKARAEPVRRCSHPPELELLELALTAIIHASEALGCGDTEEASAKLGVAEENLLPLRPAVARLSKAAA